MRGRMVGAVCLGGLVFCLTGCAENLVTRERFNTIVEGTSTKLDVRHTLGDKYMDQGGQWEYDRMDEDMLVVKVYFDDNGVVTRKQWIDGKTNEFTGAAPGIDENPPGEKILDETRSGTVNQGR